MAPGKNHLKIYKLGDHVYEEFGEIKKRNNEYIDYITVYDFDGDGNFEMHVDCAMFERPTPRLYEIRGGRLIEYKISFYPELDNSFSGFLEELKRRILNSPYLINAQKSENYRKLVNLTKDN